MNKFQKQCRGRSDSSSLGWGWGGGAVQWGTVGSSRKDFLIESLNRVLKAKEKFTNWTKRETASWPEETV